MMLYETESLGVSALFWSHIVAIHLIATFAERVGDDIDTLAGWRKLFQQFQLAHLLIICDLCEAWSNWFWLCTGICTLVRIVGLQCVSKAVVSKADADGPRTECRRLVTWKLPNVDEHPPMVSDDSTRPAGSKEFATTTNEERTIFEGRAMLPNDTTPTLPLITDETEVPTSASSATSIDDALTPAKLAPGKSEGDDNHDDVSDSSEERVSVIPATLDVGLTETGAKERSDEPEQPSEVILPRPNSSRQSRLALLRNRAKPSSSARGADDGSSSAADNCKTLRSDTPSSDADAPHRTHEDGIDGTEQPKLRPQRPSVLTKAKSTGMITRQAPRPSTSMTDLTAATFGFDLSSLEIMVVEDDAIQQIFVEKFLGNHGLKAVCVDCGEDAISLLEGREKKGGQETFPAMILMDLMMPGMNGHETTEEIRKLFPTAALPIIMLTSDESEETVVEAVRRGANDILTKTHLKGCLVARIAAQLSTLRFWRSKLDAQKNEQLLQEILPVSVIQRLNEGPRLIYDQHPEVSIVFTDIVGFTDLASSVPTKDLIEMLDKLFNIFDTLSDKHGVYKVETIGDAYMVVAGHEASSKGDHAIRTVRMAADMVAAASCMTMPNGKPLKIRAGVHSGPAFSGVVGWKRPRFCMFGDTVNVASRMESTSFSSCVQLSNGTHEYYRAQQQQVSSDGAAAGNLEFESLGPRDIKGKGLMKTFLAKVGDWEEAVKHLDVAAEEGGLKVQYRLMSMPLLG